MALEGIAGVASIQLRPELAARLLGAAEAQREAIELHRPPIGQPLYERILLLAHLDYEEKQLNPTLRRIAG